MSGPSAGKRTPAVIERAQDLAVTAIAEIAWHSPDVDGPGKAEYPNMNARGVRLPCVATPIAAVAENREPPHVDVDAFRHVDIDVPNAARTVTSACSVSMVALRRSKSRSPKALAAKARRRSLNRPRRTT